MSGMDFLMKAAINSLGITPEQVKELLNTSQGVAGVFTEMVVTLKAMNERQMRIEAQMTRIEAALENGATLHLSPSTPLIEGTVNHEHR